ncbi:UNVERIFIED_CONTAM: hypothetical protein PYX00_008322 [Menopon gallinae]|uniref:ELMO domain-containing protein n=1 Tax=Menopon gallinae TaxID=328185 RepID=A0AAW2HNU8_9NEOP
MLYIQSLFSLLYWFTRPLIKWFLRKTTRLCELQRICYGEVSGAPRVLAVEKSLSLSRNAAIRELPFLYETRNPITPRGALQHAITTVIKIKNINPQVHIQFSKSFGKCMEQIWGFSNLKKTVEDLRCTQYDSNNPAHEEKLLNLWTLLVPDEKLESRVTKQWQYIGFQGDDPKTDFRGMGVLGLENLLFLASEYTDIAHRMLVRSQHPKHGYAFAIVGINLTHLAYHLLEDGSAKTHVYNTSKSPPSMRTFHQFYSYLYVEFDKFWVNAKPNNIMDFSFIRDRFEKEIRESLKNPKTVFRINVAVDKI